MPHIAWGKPGNETKLEKVRFALLTTDSSGCATLYDFFEKKQFSKKWISGILCYIESTLQAIKDLLPSAGTNNDSKESSIHCNIKSNTSILVKLITSSPDLVKGRTGRNLLRILIFSLHLPISVQDKELIHEFMKKYYSIKQISSEKKSILTMYKVIGKYPSKNFDEMFLMTSSYVREYARLLRIFSLFRNGKISEIKCLLRNQIEYNHILISLILQRNPAYIKEDTYADYHKNRIIQKIVSDYEREKQKKEPSGTP